MDIEIKESGQFQLLGVIPKDHADEDFGNANADLRGRSQGKTLDPDELDVIGYVDDRDEANALCRTSDYVLDGKVVYIQLWRDIKKEKAPANASTGPISKRDV